MERIELLKNYNTLNNSFKRKMTFHLGADAGFFSEFNNMVLAMIYCLDNQIKFSLYSKKGNFSLSRGWADFFMPFCEEKTSFLHQRYNRRSYQIKKAKALPPIFLKFLSGDDFLTQDIWDRFRTEEFSKRRFTVPELNLIDAPLLDATKRIIQMIWHYNPTSEKIVEDYKKSIDLPESFISIHIRAGDKIKETNTYSTNVYMEKASSFSPKKSAFILTDNFSVIEDLQNSYSDWDFFTLCLSTELGYDHSEFTKLDKYQKYLQHLKLFSSLDICATSDKFIGSYSSNPGGFMAMRIGEENCACLDYDSWVLW